MAESGPHVSGTMECGDNSDWMSKLSEKVTRLSLWNLALPGRQEGKTRGQARPHVVTRQAVMMIEATEP